MAKNKILTLQEKIDAAKARQKALEDELRKAQIRSKNIEKKTADRRKFILGNYLTKRMEADPDLKKSVMADLDRELDINANRAIFGLSKIDEKPKKRWNKREVEAEPAPVAPVPFGEKTRQPAQSFEDIVGQLKKS